MAWLRELPLPAGPMLSLVDPLRIPAPWEVRALMRGNKL